MTHYFEINLYRKPGFLAGLLVKAVHHQRYINPGSTLAVAFPELKVGSDPENLPAGENMVARTIGRVVRVFGDPDDLVALHDLTSKEWVTDLSLSPFGLKASEAASLGTVRPMPEEIQLWIAYTRFRVPPRKRSGREKAMSPEYQALRLKHRAEMLSLSYRIPSISVATRKEKGGHQAIIGIKPVPLRDDPSNSQGKLNGYGLSSKTQPVYLPHF